MGVKVKDSPRLKKILRQIAIASARKSTVKVGIQGADAEADHGGISNVRLGAVHEFGKKIKHPGGTPYMVVGEGRAVFLKKGDPRAIGTTRPHTITIPQRSFLRSTFDEKQGKYKRMLKKAAERIVAGEDPKAGLFVLGETVRGDILNKMSTGKIKPGLKAATIRRKKGEKTPLVETSELMGSITSVLDPK